MQIALGQPSLQMQQNQRDCRDSSLWLLQHSALTAGVGPVLHAGLSAASSR